MSDEDKLHYFARHGVHAAVFEQWFRSLPDDDKCAALYELNVYQLRMTNLLKIANDNFVLTEREDEHH